MIKEQVLDMLEQAKDSILSMNKETKIALGLFGSVILGLYLWDYVIW